jgi:hypothetical protein
VSSTPPPSASAPTAAPAAAAPAAPAASGPLEIVGAGAGAPALTPDDLAMEKWVEEMTALLARDKAQAQTIFKRMDRNGDNSLSPKEFMEGMRALKVRRDSIPH